MGTLVPIPQARTQPLSPQKHESGAPPTALAHRERSVLGLPCIPRSALTPRNTRECRPPAQVPGADWAGTGRKLLGTGPVPPPADTGWGPELSRGLAGLTCSAREILGHGDTCIYKRPPRDAMRLFTGCERKCPNFQGRRQSYKRGTWDQTYSNLPLLSAPPPLTPALNIPSFPPFSNFHVCRKDSTGHGGWRRAPGQGVLGEQAVIPTAPAAAGLLSPPRPTPAPGPQTLQTPELTQPRFSRARHTRPAGPHPGVLKPRLPIRITCNLAK